MENTYAQFPGKGLLLSPKSVEKRGSLPSFLLVSSLSNIGTKDLHLISPGANCSRKKVGMSDVSSDLC